MRLSSWRDSWDGEGSPKKIKKMKRKPQPQPAKDTLKTQTAITIGELPSKTLRRTAIDFYHEIFIDVDDMVAVWFERERIAEHVKDIRAEIAEGIEPGVTEATLKRYEKLLNMLRLSDINVVLY